MRVTELQPRLWRWTGRHPDWTPGEGGEEGWEEEVACLYLEAPAAVVLIDPLVPPEDRDRFLEHLDRDVARAGRPVEILLTIHWHERSAHELASRYEGTVWAFERSLHRLGAAPHRTFGSGTELPGGVRAFDAKARDEAVLWLPEHGALVTGDVLLGDAQGGLALCPASWLNGEDSHARLRTALAPLLDLRVESVLPGHGEPVLAGAREALARALRA